MFFQKKSLLLAGLIIGVAAMVAAGVATAEDHKEKVAPAENSQKSVESDDKAPATCPAAKACHGDQGAKKACGQGEGKCGRMGKSEGACPMTGGKKADCPDHAEKMKKGKGACGTCPAAQKQVKACPKGASAGENCWQPARTVSVRADGTRAKAGGGACSGRWHAVSSNWHGRSGSVAD